jgi:hypothetical protein
MRTIYVTAQSAPTAGARESADSPLHKSVLIRHNWPNSTASADFSCQKSQNRSKSAIFDHFEQNRDFLKICMIEKVAIQHFDIPWAGVKG